MTTRKNLFLSFALFLGVALLLSWLLFYGKQQAEDRYVATVLEHHRKAYASILDSYRRLTTFVAAEVFLRPEATALFAEAATADKEVERDRLRDRLYANLLPSYKSLVPQGYRQVIYTFADGTAFLRMHMPEWHGDQLFTVHPALRRAYTERRFVQGFELGKRFHAFRYVFPLQHEGNYVGIVEFGVPFYAVSQALQNVYAEEYSLVLKKEALEQVLVVGENYPASELAPGYMQEKADVAGDFSQHSGHISREMRQALDVAIQPRLGGDLAKGEAFARAVRLGGQDYLATFLPVTDVEGHAIGYVVAYGKDSTMTSLRHGYIVAQLLASVLLLLLFVLHSWSTGKIAAQLNFQRQLMEAIPTPVCLKGGKGEFLQCNQSFAELFRLPKEQILGRTNASLIAPQAAEQQQRLDEQVMATGKSRQGELHMPYPDGTSRELVVSKAPFFDERGRVIGVIGAAFDLTERKEMERKLRQAHADLDQIFNTAANGMLVIGADCRVMRANQTFYALVGQTEQEVLGRNCYELVPSEACHTEHCPLSRILGFPQRLEAEMTKALPSGRKLECAITSTPYYGANGEVIGIIEDFKDISHYKAMERLLRDTAITDELTGLFNRRGFLTLAEKQLGAAVRADHDVFLVYADLDDMKVINDTMGHSYGDFALTTTAALLRETFRQADIVARQGGDEFAILATCKRGTESETAIFSRLANAVALENQGGELPFVLAVSAGIVRMEEGETLEQLMIRADNRMYENKRRRKEGGKG